MSDFIQRRKELKGGIYKQVGRERSHGKGRRDEKMMTKQW